MSRFYFVAVVLVIGILAGTGVAVGAPLGLFLNVPSLILVVAPTLLLVAANFTVREIGTCFSISFRREGARRIDLELARVFFSALGRYLGLIGSIGALIGLIELLATLGDSAAIGSGVALALMTALYGLILYVAVVIPFQAGIRRRIAEADFAGR